MREGKEKGGECTGGEGREERLYSLALTRAMVGNHLLLNRSVNLLMWYSKSSRDPTKKTMVSYHSCYLSARCQLFNFESIMFTNFATSELWYLQI